ncbi:MAG: metal/formaldehyde-sensitive transcriptional repressor [Acidobacteriaceae bacterium]
MQMDRERVKLVNRAKRIHGQMERVERTLMEEQQDCGNVLMLLAAVRGGIDGLMAEVLEDHIRLHLIGPKAKALTPELGEELIDLVRAYMK